MNKKHQSVLSILAFLGVALSVVSLYEHVAANSGLELGKSFCNINASFNCDAVNQSKWSSLFGVPIASYGLAFYLFLFVFGQFARSDRFVSDRVFSGVFSFLSTMAMLVSLFLFYVSEVLIGTLCLVCLGMYLVNIGLFVFSYRLPSHYNFLDRLGNGFTSLLGGLTLPFSSDTERRIIGNAGFVFVVVSFFMIRSLPDFFLINYILPSAQTKEYGEAAKGAVDAWRSAPPTVFESQSESMLSADFRIGDDNKPIQIVEFSDFECPACRRLAGELEELIGKLQLADKISFTFKNFPIDNACNPYIHRVFHKHACFAAQFARCAGEQGKFWEATSFLFANQSFEEKLEIKELQDRIYKDSEVLGLDLEAQKSCVESGRHLEKIRSDIEQGTKLGVEGTPSVWINGKRVEMPAPEVLTEIFKSLLPH